MVVIGLTGNIASGKSTAAKILQEFGCLVIDADQVGRDVIEPGQPAYVQLKQAFGEDYFLPDGKLNRKKLGSYVFASPQALTVLNDITHPAIRLELLRRIQRQQEKKPQQVIVIEAAVLLEANMQSLADCLWLVVAEDEIRLQRAMERDNLSAALVKDRMNRQMPQQEKMKYADYIVHNNKGPQELRQEMEQVWQQFLKDYSLETKK